VFESLTAVGIVVAFLVPGYLWRVTEGQLVYLDRKLEWEKFAFGLLTRSTIIYLPWGPFLYRGYSEAWYDSAPWLTLLFCVLIAIVQPVLYGAVWGFFRQRGYDRKVFALLGWKTFEQSHAPTAWDAMFSQRRESCWIIVTLKDNTKVQGWFGVRSHASSDDDQRDLFVSHVLTQRADGQKEFVMNTGGVYISADEIKTIEFINDAEDKT
jgi:hypothetical protein